MAKTYPLKALWPLLPFEVAAAPLLATLDAYGGGLVKYAVNLDGIWLFSLAQPLTASESENLTGYHPADLVPKQIDGVEGYFYAMQGGAPLLPLPFTKDQLIAFEKRMAGLIGSCIERGDDTDAWITDLEKDNPDAAELTRGIHGGKWTVGTACGVTLGQRCGWTTSTANTKKPPCTSTQDFTSFCAIYPVHSFLHPDTWQDIHLSINLHYQCPLSHNHLTVPSTFTKTMLS